MIKEKKAPALPGGLMLIAMLVVTALSIYMLIDAGRSGAGAGPILGWIFVLVATGISVFGLTVVNPNEANVVVLFGSYIGTLKEFGFWWVNPFAVKRKVSLRVRNFESAKLKVNDLEGNPIEIAAIVVWRVAETAEAMFNVNNYENFVTVQSEAAVRNLASTYAYDSHIDAHHSLRSHVLEVADKLKVEIQERVATAGLEILEARISHLAYAPEIASAMLQRQQASAIVAARTKIVEGAVGMVEMALDELNKKGVVQLDEERKAAMVSNLLVVLCSNAHTQPVVNTGTLYH